MKIVIINGEARVGKDSFVHFCSQIEPYQIYNLSIIDAVKTAAAVFDWDRKDKSESARRFLSDLKDSWARFNDGPYKTIEQRIKLIKALNEEKESNILIFIHSREPEDIQRFVQDYNAQTLLIRRAAVEGPHQNHADADVYEWNYDWIIENNGDLEELKESARSFIEEFMKED